MSKQFSIALSQLEEKWEEKVALGEMVFVCSSSSCCFSFGKFALAVAFLYEAMISSLISARMRVRWSERVRVRAAVFSSASDPGSF